MVDDTDAPFRQSLADLSRQLASRVPIEPPEFDPKLPDELPTEPDEPARRRRRFRPGLALLALAVGFGAAAIVNAMLGAENEPQPPARTVAAVVPPPPSDPAPPPTADALEPTKRVTFDPPPPAVAPIVVAAPEPAPPKGKLEGYEVMEIQTRLKAAGLDPGPLDGISGGLTASAIREYQASKGKPQTGKLDRELLSQLRKEPERKEAPKP